MMGIYVETHEAAGVTLAGIKAALKTMRHRDLELLADLIETERSKGLRSAKRVTGSILAAAVK